MVRDINYQSSDVDETPTVVGYSFLMPLILFSLKRLFDAHFKDFWDIALRAFLGLDIRPCMVKLYVCSSCNILGFAISYKS